MTETSTPPPAGADAEAVRTAGSRRMTDPVAADAQAVARAVDEIQERRAGERRRVLALMALCGAVAAAAVAVAVLGGSGELFAAGIVVAIAAVIAGLRVRGGAQARVRETMTSRVMPILCRMAGGLDHAREGRPGIDLGAAGLVPRANRMRTEDEVRGTIGGLPFRSWDLLVWDEVHRQSGGKRAVVLLRGIAVTVETGAARDLAVHLPRPTVASIAAGLFGLGAETRKIVVRQTTYEIDLHPEAFDVPKLAAAVEALISALPEGARLEGIHQSGGVATLSVHLGRDLYEMGGLFASRAALLTQVEAAMGDLALPGRLAATWAGAERAVPRADT